MYYSEKMIDGVLHYRTHPNEKWKPMSLEQLSQRVEELEKKLFDLRTDQN